MYTHETPHTGARRGSRETDPPAQAARTARVYIHVIKNEQDGERERERAVCAHALRTGVCGVLRESVGAAERVRRRKRERREESVGVCMWSG